MYKVETHVHASTIYLPWNDNTCTTYCSLDATWYADVFDVNYN